MAVAQGEPGAGVKEDPAVLMIVACGWARVAFARQLQRQLPALMAKRAFPTN